MANSVNGYLIPDPGDVIAGADHHTIADSMMNKHSLSDVVGLMVVMTRLANVAIQEQLAEKHQDGDSERRRKAREAVKAAKSSAAKALFHMHQLRENVKAFRTAVGSASPAGAILATVFPEHTLDAFEAPDSYYVISNFGFVNDPQLKYVIDHLAEIAKTELKPQSKQGKMQDAYLNAALDICYEFCISEGKGWGKGGMKNDVALNFNNFSFLKDPAEKLTTDLLRLAGISFTLRQIHGRWDKTQKRGRAALSGDQADV